MEPGPGIRGIAGSGPARLALVALLLLGATGVIALLSGVAGAAASPVYLIPVVAAAALSGTRAAIAVTVVAVLLFDVLFTEPRFTLTVDDPRDIIDVVVFLFVAVVVGRLAGRLADRVGEAQLRAAEAQALFSVSRAIAVAPSLEDALPEVLARLAIEAGMARAWVTLGVPPTERLLAAAGPRPEMPSASVATLSRSSDARPAWIRTRDARGRATGPSDANVYRVKLEADGEVLGSLWATRRTGDPDPGRSHSRLLALAADQVALALRREQLASAATGAEVARQSDRLKSALLDSVSHDLRTPLSGIRALAGGLMDPDLEPTSDARRAAAAAIDAEALRLDRLVRDLLDASRIGAGGLRPDLEACDLEALVIPVVDRLRPRLAPRAVEVSLPDDLAPVWVDPLFVEQVVANLLENVVRHAAPGAGVRVSAVNGPGGGVSLTVEDAGPGLSPEARTVLFEPGRPRPARAPTYDGAPARSGAGLGLGTGIVRGLVEAMGGQVTAHASPMGGLAVRVMLPGAPAPVPEDGP